MVIGPITIDRLLPSDWNVPLALLQSAFTATVPAVPENTTVYCAGFGTLVVLPLLSAVVTHAHLVLVSLVNFSELPAGTLVWVDVALGTVVGVGAAVGADACVGTAVGADACVGAAVGAGTNVGTGIGLLPQATLIINTTTSMANNTDFVIC
jgi:hypothetical protein